MRKNYFAENFGVKKISQLLTCSLFVAVTMFYGCSKDDNTASKIEEETPTVAPQNIMYVFDDYSRPLDFAIKYAKQDRAARSASESGGAVATRTASSANNQVSNVQFITASDILGSVSSGSGGSNLPMMKTASQNRDTVMYVINYANNGGFSIVTNDYRVHPFVGMSEKGSFDVANMPDNVRYVISCAIENYYMEIEEFEEAKANIPQQQIQQLKANNKHYTLYNNSDSKANSLMSKMSGDGDDDNGDNGDDGDNPNPHDAPHAPEPYVKYTRYKQRHLTFPQKYDQGQPFNNKAPEYPNAWGIKQHAVAGCVAVAMAQIMVYHKWPYRVANMVMPWNDMAVYSGSPTYWTAMPAIQTLLRDIGDKLNNDWGLSGTGASTADAPSVYISYGYYSSDLYNFNKGDILTSIDKSRPIHIRGEDGGGEGHAWVIFGYKDTAGHHRDWVWNNETKEYELGPDYYNFARTDYDCNFGWGGVDDGTYGVVYGTTGYSRGLKIITNIHII